MFAGEIMGTFRTEDADLQEIGLLMAGSRRPDARQAASHLQEGGAR